MCGKHAPLTATKVAGSTMQLCNSCKGHGSVEKNVPTSKVFYKSKKELPKEHVVDNYQSKIMKALSEKGYNAHQLARAISLKESSLNKFLTGKLHPDINTAKRIENFLEISLVEESTSQAPVEDFLVDDEEEQTGTSLGDLLKKELNK